MMADQAPLIQFKSGVLQIRNNSFVMKRKVHFGVSKEEFDVFVRFCQHQPSVLQHEMSVFEKPRFHVFPHITMNLESLF